MKKILKVGLLLIIVTGATLGIFLGIILLHVSTEPKFLMIDEVFAGLSLEESEEMIRVLNKLNKEKNITILLIDHNLSMVKRMVEKTTVIDMGKIIAEGSFEEIIEDERVRKAYVG